MGANQSTSGGPKDSNSKQTCQEYRQTPCLNSPQPYHILVRHYQFMHGDLSSGWCPGVGVDALGPRCRLVTLLQFSKVIAS